MENAEEILAGFKKEVAALTERCILAEVDKDTYHRLYEVYARDYVSAAKDRDALKNELAEEKKTTADKLEVATQYAEELLAKIARLTKWVEDQGGNADIIMSGKYEEKEWVKEDAAT